MNARTDSYAAVSATDVTEAFARRSPPARLPLAARLMLTMLRRIEHGQLTVHFPDGREETIVGRFTGPHAVLNINDPSFARRVLVGSDVAFAEAYMADQWNSPDLAALLTLLARNGDAFGKAYYSRGLSDWLFRLRHLLRANTRRQARRNIEAHYDLGNDFYRLWLDETMTYSAGLFAGEPSRDLPEAQNAKYDRILAQLDAPAGGHLLEIGCGWGGFAERAARRGYRVTCVTLSPSQRAYAIERIARAGLADRVRIALCDYRDIARTFPERFDGIASIEMFEAVGQQFWPAYFTAVERALAPGARAAIQVITVDDRRFERYARTSDFIQQYIFPGGMLPSPERFMAQARKAGLGTIGRYEFGADYAETLRRWLAVFDARIDAVRAQGFDERFIRMWRFYLAYCIAGFSTGSITVGQYTLAAADPCQASE